MRPWVPSTALKRIKGKNKILDNNSRELLQGFLKSSLLRWNFQTRAVISDFLRNPKKCIKNTWSKAQNNFTDTSTALTVRNTENQDIQKPLKKVKYKPVKKLPKIYLIPRSVITKINNNDVMLTFLGHKVSTSSKSKNHEFSQSPRTSSTKELCLPSLVSPFAHFKWYMIL